MNSHALIRCFNGNGIESNLRYFQHDLPVFSRGFSAYVILPALIADAMH